MPSAFSAPSILVAMLLVGATLGLANPCQAEAKLREGPATVAEKAVLRAKPTDANAHGPKLVAGKQVEVLQVVGS